MTNTSSGPNAPLTLAEHRAMGRLARACLPRVLDWEPNRGPNGWIEASLDNMSLIGNSTPAKVKEMLIAMQAWKPG